MEGLRAVQLTAEEGAALAAVLEAHVADFSAVVPDHDIVQHVLRTGGAIHVVTVPTPAQAAAKARRG